MTEEQFLIIARELIFQASNGNWHQWALASLCDNWHEVPGIDPEETDFSTLIDAYCYGGYLDIELMP